MRINSQDDMQELPLFDDELKMEESRLAKLIEHHNKLYWEDAEPEIRDEEFDSLVRKLEALNPRHPVLARIYTPSVAASGKVRHKKPMLSLDKAYSLEDVLTWAAKYSRSADEIFTVQPKYDGISANFADGILATRGDGVDGENVSDKITLIELEKTDYRGSLDRPARGEIIIRDDDFKNIYQKIIKKDGRPYKNSRNAVAGMMGLKDISDMLAQGAKLTFVDYELITFRVKFSEIADQWPHILLQMEKLPYPMDGLVIKLDDENYSESLGNTAHHPRSQIAFKFSGVRKKTRLLDVIWSFGKNCLTPVAQLDPVDIGGITIKQATLHNLQNIIDRDIQVGDTVTVERAGDVIPYIVSGEAGADRRPCTISKCPCCSSELIKDGPELRCVNPECLETNVQRLLASVRNIGIERLGEPNIRKMMKNLNVKSLKNVFSLTMEQILTLEGFKGKSAENLYAEIQSARKVSDFELLASLNIEGVGKNLAKMLLSKYSLAELRKLSKEDLSQIHGIGNERAEAISSELRRLSESLDELLACLEIIESARMENLPVSKTICFTGKMPEKRSYYESLAREKGWEPVDSVTKDLSLLVAADLAEKSSKIEKARKNGIRVSSLSEWTEEIQKSSSK